MLRLCRGCVEGKLDAGLLALPVADDQLQYTEFLFEEPFVLAVPESHRPRSRGR